MARPPGASMASAGLFGMYMAIRVWKRSFLNLSVSTKADA